MINGISIVSVWVLDQDSAKEFYTEKLGFTLTNDIQLEGGMRWLTVRPPGSDTQDLLLMDPLHSMLDEETAQQVRALVAKGALSPGVMATSDCRLGQLVQLHPGALPEFRRRGARLVRHK
jgi:catechol 2,3-dioxygenase-like lactoylglutathione lyase family enzyme